MKKLTFILSITLTLSAFAQVPSYVPTNGLVGWWPFNGNANDESGNGNNGTVNGATLTTDRFGNVSSAYSFDGINDNIEITNSNSLNPISITISGWIYSQANAANEESGAKGVVTKWFQQINCNNNSDNYNVQLSLVNNESVLIGSTMLNNQVTNAVSTSTNLIGLNNWKHFVFIQNNLGRYMYIDGVLINSNNTGGNLCPTVNNLFFGADNNFGAPWRFFLGNLDDIGIWNRALTPQEVAALYNGCQQSIQTQPQTQTASFNDNVQFTAASSDPNASYQWQTNVGLGFQNLTDAGQYSGSVTNTLNVSNVTLSNNNQQFRCIIASGSCSDTSDVALLSVNDNLSISENSETLIQVYPNPAKETITISSDASIVGKDFSIINQLGQVVILGKIVQQEVSVDLSDLSTGVYVIRIDGVEKSSFRFVKE